jgi:hypothetical protein
MTSSLPVVTPNAILFTPDNKRCYAYSGEVSVDDNETALLEFKTNTEYLDGLIQFNYIQVTSENFSYKVYFNDIVVQGYTVTHAIENTSPDNLIPIIIPPFTAVKLTAVNIEDDNSRGQIVSFTGRAIGMTETGYQ